MGYYGFKPYVPVAKRRAQAAKEVATRVKQGQSISPIQIEGRKITTTFWGRAWCDNLESYSDFANRLPRGRTYVRNGSVVDLKITRGRIEALVSGSELYKVQIEIAALPGPNWRSLRAQCAGAIGSLVELLQGQLSKAVMEQVTDRREGLFPNPSEIKMRCSCPDYAGMCKHVAAALYGVGNRLDSAPELLFALRGVNHLELIEQAIPTSPVKTKGRAPKIATDDLGTLFDIEIGEAPVTRAKPSNTAQPAAKPAPKKTPTPTRAAAKQADARTTRASTPKPATPKPTTAKQAPTAKAVPPKPTTARVVLPKPTTAKKVPTTKVATPKQNPAKKAPAARQTRAKLTAKKG